MLNIIDKILNNKYKESSATMVEKSHEVDMSVEIQSRKGKEFLLYKFCEKSYKADHFARVEGLSKMCDYFLFVEDKKKLYVFAIELKKSSGASADKQLLAGECFINFIINTANRIGEDINITNCVIRRVKAVKQQKRKIKNQALFKDGYCANFSLGKFDIDYMIAKA